MLPARMAGARHACMRAGLGDNWRVMDRAIDCVVETLRREVGEAQGRLYLYGSRGQPAFQPGHSNVNLLAVVADGFDILALRPAFLALWAEHGESLRRAPAVAHASAVVRHMELAPVFGLMLLEEGRCLWGELPVQWPAVEAPPLARLAYLAQEAMRGSAALAPQLLTSAEAETAYLRLHRVARHLEESAFSGRPPASTLFARIQIQLRQRISEALGETEPHLITSPDAPNLQGVYTETDRVVVLLPPLSEPLLMALDWEAIAERLAAQHTVIEATTARQLVLIQEHETALAFVLGRFHHLWGIDPLADLRVPLRTVLQTAGRAPSQLLVERIGGDYLTAAGDEALHMIVHDYQNRLLNLRLQHELLHRLHGMDAAEPPEPLPPRTAPFVERVTGVMQHLDWWAGHYAALSRQAPEKERVSAV